MLQKKLKDYAIILASGSPRRQQFFKDLGLSFEIRLKPVEEVYSDDLAGSSIADYLSQLKALPFKEELVEKEILITSDTIVWSDNIALGKPKDEKEAVEMIRSLSGKSHEVITAVSFTTKDDQKTINDTTTVFFKTFTEEEINYYVKNFQPYDKAGSYGIQEWIGLIGVTKIEGSYFNVMGLPTHLVYETLITMTS